MKGGGMGEFPRGCISAGGTNLRGFFPPFNRGGGKSRAQKGVDFNMRGV